MEQRDDIESQYALQLAFKKMKDRYQQLQVKLAAVEEENILLRQYKKQNSMTILRLSIEDENIIKSQQEKIKELKEQKSQLIQHIFVVSSENRQLCKKLTQLSGTNKSFFDKQLVKVHEQSSAETATALTDGFKDISRMFKNSIDDKYNLPDNAEKRHNLEETTLQLNNSFVIENLKMEKEYSEIVELQTSTEITLKNIGCTYPEVISTDSLEQLKYHDVKLTELKEELFIQQNKLKNALHNLKKIKKNETCDNCKNTVEKLIPQTGTQFNAYYNLKEHEITENSLSTCSFIPQKEIQTSRNKNICPLCGLTYKKSASFKLFYEHVINHFNMEIIDDFKISV